MVSKPVRYPGGAWSKFNKLKPFFPHHSLYDSLIESFGGVMSVALRIDHPKLEIKYNDLNGRLVNMFEVLRNSPDELFVLLNLTVYSDRELQTCLVESSDPIEDARRFWTLLHMAHYPFDNKPVMKSNIVTARKANGTGAMVSNAARFHNLNHIYEIAGRLRDAEIKQIEGLTHLSYYSHDRSFAVVDPPWIHETRSRTAHYAFEDANSRDYHAKVVDTMLTQPGYMMLLGRWDEVYQPLADNGWLVNQIDTVNDGGVMKSEVFIINPKLVNAKKGDF